MGLPEPKRSRWLLAAWAVSVFALSAVTDLRVLAGAALLAPALLWRGAATVLRRCLVTIVPFVGVLVLASWAWVRLVQGAWPPWPPYAALALRAVLIAFLTFSVLRRVDLLRAVAAWPTVSRLLVVTLAQVHALRLLATESLQGLKSRLPRKPRARDAVRGAGGVTATLVLLATRNARDVTDALRSRGF